MENFCFPGCLLSHAFPHPPQPMHPLDLSKNQGPGPRLLSNSGIEAQSGESWHVLQLRKKPTETLKPAHCHSASQGGLT